MSIKNLLPFLILLLLVISCANLENRNSTGLPAQPQASTTKSTSPADQSNAAKQNSEKAAAQNFSPDIICSIPKQVAQNTPFAGLGGGSWAAWDEEGSDLGYGCNGGKDTIKLKDDGAGGDVIAEYGAIGGKDTVRYVSAEYTAMQFAGLTTEEKKFRQQYADFCDKLSLKFYGAKLPEKFRKRLLDESTYSPSGTANEYGEKVGFGYVNLSSNKNKNVMVMLDVHFFASEDEYKKYKDS